MTWWRRLLQAGRMERELEQELRFHLEERVAALQARGRTEAQARREARLELGGVEQVKEECRQARGTRWLQDLGRDAAFGLRLLRRRPGFVLVALATLGLGIGASAVMFTVIQGVLYRPYPYRQPSQLLQLQEQTVQATQWGNLWAFSYPNFLDLQRGCRALQLAAFRFGGGTVVKPGKAEYVDGREISAGLFALLGVPLARGREFLPGEDKAGAAPVAIVSYEFWQSFFAARADVLDRPLVLEGKRYRIVGVTRPGFRLADEAFDVYTPIGQDAQAIMRRRDVHPGIQVWARLRPGTTLAQATSQLNVIAARLARAYPASNEGRGFLMTPLRPDSGDAAGTLWLLLGAVSLVFLIACANLASLLLARAVAREREFALRAALGAGRSRLVRQCLSESALLALAGGALGLALARLGLAPFVALWPGSLPRAQEVHLDAGVLLVALALALASGLFFGLAPALRVPTRQLDHALRSGARLSGADTRRWHTGFVVLQIALAVVLLAAAGALGRTLLRLAHLDPGVDTHNVLTARVALSAPILANPQQTRVDWDETLRQIAAVRGVRAVAMVDTVPMREGNNPIGYSTQPQAPPPDRQPLVLANSVSPDYLRVMKLHLLAGRFFTDADRRGAPEVAVIDEVMARQAFPGQDPIGKPLWGISLDNQPVTVVGVVRHVRYWGLAQDDTAKIRAQLYYPFAQVPDRWVRRWSELMSIAVRTTGNPLALMPALQKAVASVHDDQVLYEVQSLDQLASASIAQQRFLLVLFAVFAAFALLLACIGTYGVMAYVTSQRVPEIGVRMALGASRKQVQWMILGQSLRLIVVGSAVGGLGAWIAVRLLRQQVAGMAAGTPAVLGLALPLLAAAALAASYFPARRASRLDPAQVVRQD